MSLVVEDGTGLLLAQSYASVAEADAYFLSFGNEDWPQDTESILEKEVALRKASRDLDLMYASLWTWLPLSLGQGLLFPRNILEGVPVNLKRATIELAGLILGGFEVFAFSSDSEIAEKSIKVDGFESSIKYITDRRTLPELDRIRKILGFLVPAINTSFGYARVVRG